MLRFTCLHLSTKRCQSRGKNVASIEWKWVWIAFYLIIVNSFNESIDLCAVLNLFFEHSRLIHFSITQKEKPLLIFYFGLAQLREGESEKYLHFSAFYFWKISSNTDFFCYSCLVSFNRVRMALKNCGDMLSKEAISEKIWLRFYKNGKNLINFSKIFHWNVWSKWMYWRMMIIVYLLL